jgi:hypothetical protein
MGVQNYLAAVDEIGHVTGHTSIYQGQVVDWFGGVSFRLHRNLPEPIKTRGREIVDEAYRIFSDHDVEREAQYHAAKIARKQAVKAGMEVGEATAEEKGYQRNATVTMATMTDMQRALYDAQIKRALDFIPDLYKELDRYRRRAEGITKVNIEKGAYVVGQKVTNRAQKLARARNLRSRRKRRGRRTVPGLRRPDMPRPRRLTEDWAAIRSSEQRHPKVGLQYGAELNWRDKTTPYLAHIAGRHSQRHDPGRFEQLGAMLKAATRVATGRPLTRSAGKPPLKNQRKGGGDLLTRRTLSSSRPSTARCARPWACPTTSACPRAHPP